jgi:organic hydroperoxide reductase OsmC/OhrA
VTFSAIAEMSKLNFLSLEVSAEGKLGKIDGKLAFVEIVIHPQLVLCASEDHDLGHRLLKKAEQGCLLARSLACPVIMEATVCSGDRVRFGSGDLIPAN